MKQKTTGEWAVWVLRYAGEVAFEILKLAGRILRGVDTRMESDLDTYQNRKNRYTWKD